jgi:hypothetical protein
VFECPSRKQNTRWRSSGIARKRRMLVDFGMLNESRWWVNDI